MSRCRHVGARCRDTPAELCACGAAHPLRLATLGLLLRTVCLPVGRAVAQTTDAPAPAHGDGQGGRPGWHAVLVTVFISLGAIACIVAVTLMIHRYLRRVRHRVLAAVAGMQSDELAAQEAASLHAAQRWHAASPFASRQQEQQQPESGHEGGAAGGGGGGGRQPRKRAALVIQPDLGLDMGVETNGNPTAAHTSSNTPDDGASSSGSSGDGSSGSGGARWGGFRWLPPPPPPFSRAAGLPAHVQRLAVQLPELGATVLVFLPVPPSLLRQLPAPPPLSYVEVRPEAEEQEQEEEEPRVEADQQQQGQQGQGQQGQGQQGQEQRREPDEHGQSQQEGSRCGDEGSRP